MTPRSFVLAAAVAAALSQSSAAFAQAPDAETLQTARELAGISIPAGLSDQVIAQSWVSVEDLFRRSAPQLPEDKIAALKKEYLTMMQSEMANSMAEAPNFFLKYFSTKEMKDLIVFYKTDIGKKMLAVTPTMMNELMQNANRRLAANMARFQESAVRIIAGVAPR